MKIFLLIFTFFFLLGTTTLSEALTPGFQRERQVDQSISFNEEKQKQLDLIKKEVRERLEEASPNLDLPIFHEQRGIVQEESEKLVREAEMIREKIEAINLADSPAAREQKNAIQREAEKLVREAEAIREEIKPIGFDFFIPQEPNNGIQKRIKNLAEETRSVRKEAETVDFRLDSPVVRHQKEEIRKNIERLAKETEAFREEIEFAVLEWEDLILSEREIMERHLSEWESAIQKYEEILAAGEDPSGYLKGRMRSLIRELSVSEANIEKITALGDPRTEGVIVDEVFRITEMMVKETVFLPDGREDLRKLLIRGIGPPDTTIFLFIYSTPIIVSTVTDSRGNWTYLLEREMADGTHKIYVASVDETGRILARSSPVPFVKEAAALQVNLLPFPGGELNVGTFGFFDGRIIAILLIIFTLIVIVTIILVGVAIGKRKNID